MATASWSTFEDTLLCTVTGAAVHALAAEYPQRYSTCLGHNCTELHETHITSQVESGCALYKTLKICGATQNPEFPWTGPGLGNILKNIFGSGRGI